MLKVGKCRDTRMKCEKTEVFLSSKAEISNFTELIKLWRLSGKLNLTSIVKNKI